MPRRRRASLSRAKRSPKKRAAASRRLAALELALDALDELLGGKRFRQHTLRARGQRTPHQIWPRDTRHQPNPNSAPGARRVGAKRAANIDAVHPRHIDIDDRSMDWP